MQQIPLPGGASGGEACGINQVGDVVGYSSGQQGMRAFVRRSKSEVQELAPLLNDTFSTACLINDSGQAAGTSGDEKNRHAVLWSSTGEVRDLGTLPGDSSSEATGGNVAGDIVGYSEGPKGRRAFMWNRDRGMQDLGLLPGGTAAEALAVNDSGTVVGTCAVSGESRPFVWTAQGGMQDLNQQIAPDSGIVLIGAHAINNKGQILATAVDATPCPDVSGACPMDECAPAPKYFLLLTPQNPTLHEKIKISCIRCHFESGRFHCLVKEDGIAPVCRLVRTSRRTGAGRATSHRVCYPLRGG